MQLVGFRRNWSWIYEDLEGTGRGLKGTRRNFLGAVRIVLVMERVKYLFRVSIFVIRSEQVEVWVCLLFLLRPVALLL